MYNITQLQEQNTIWGLFNYANSVANDLLFGMLMLSVFFVMVMVLKKYEIPTAILTSSFMCFILSGILTYAQLLNLIFPLMFLIIATLTAFYKYLS